jgi:hypothetical protein
MNDGLDTGTALASLDEKPSKQYRSSPYTVREYSALPYCSRLSVDLTCDEQEGITYTRHTDKTSEKPYTVGHATRKVKSAQQAQLSSTTSQPSSPMTTATAYVHPAPSPALHYLNTPELIEHNEAHPDNEHTSAVPVAAQEPDAELRSAPAIASTEVSPAMLYDIVAVAGHYVNLTASSEDTDWTHWGYSPFCGGTTHSFAVNEATGQYKCFTSLRSGQVVDLVMFMEEISQEEAVKWLTTSFPAEYVAESDIVSEVSEPEGEGSDGPACAYPGLPKFPHPITMEPTPKVEARADFAALAEATSQATMPAPAESSEPVAVEGIIYHTTNYDIFKIIDENRLLKEPSVRRLVRQITRKNLLHARPIDVSPDMEVLDGQHRLAAAKELGLPVYYKIEPDLTKEDITVLNVAQTNWAPTDYLHNWTVKGVPDYVAMSDFMKRHPIVSFSNAKVMLGTTQKHNVEEFREGKWKVGDIARAERVAELIERLDNEVATFKQAGHTQFVSAIFYCMTGLEGFDPQEFMRTVLLQPRSLVPCTSHKQFLQMFQDIYNYRKAEANRLKFL